MQRPWAYRPWGPTCSWLSRRRGRSRCATQHTQQALWPVKLASHQARHASSSHTSLPRLPGTLPAPPRKLCARCRPVLLTVFNLTLHAAGLPTCSPSASNSKSPSLFVAATSPVHSMMQHGTMPEVHHHVLAVMLCAHWKLPREPFYPATWSSTRGEEHHTALCNAVVSH